AQELPRFRRRLGAVRIRDAALMAGFLGAEPAPLIDIPLLLLVQRRLAHQVAAMYGQAAPPLFSTEGAGIITLGLGTRYLAQQLFKLVPLIGWLLSALLSGTSTWLLGMALLQRYAGDPQPTPQQFLAWLHHLLSGLRRLMAGLRRRHHQRQARGVTAIPIVSTTYEQNGGPQCLGDDGTSHG
ncbi:MAG: hypothetical protein KDD78_17310, partial [Caldilineaceae bacterium]|nr:hypothetical protein [Caldilineaceae bacterium]